MLGLNGSIVLIKVCRNRLAWIQHLEMHQISTVPPSTEHDFCSVNVRLRHCLRNITGAQPLPLSCGVVAVDSLLIRRHDEIIETAVLGFAVENSSNGDPCCLVCFAELAWHPFPTPI